MLGNEHHLRILAGPERRRCREDDAHGVGIDLLHPELAIAAQGDSRGGGVGGVLPVEDDVVRRERLAVVPGHAALQLPEDAAAVRGEPAVVAARDLRRQDRLQIAVGVPLRERLVEDPRSEVVFHAGREMRVEQRRTLPLDHPQVAAAAPLRRLVDGGRLRQRRAALAQHEPGHRQAHPAAQHPSDEVSPRQAAAPDPIDKSAQFLLGHGDPLAVKARCPPRRATSLKPPRDASMYLPAHRVVPSPLATRRSVEPSRHVRVEPRSSGCVTRNRFQHRHSSPRRAGRIVLRAPWRQLRCRFVARGVRHECCSR